MHSANPFPNLSHSPVVALRRLHGICDHFRIRGPGMGIASAIVHCAVVAVQFRHDILRANLHAAVGDCHNAVRLAHNGGEQPNSCK